LTVELRGDYALKCEGEPVSGEFSGRLRWEGRLDPDADDFLLIQVKTEALEWSLRERSGQGEAASVLDAPEALRPVLRLNYVLRTGRYRARTSRSRDGRPSAPVSLGDPSGARPSASREGARPGYCDFIRNGSNRIVLPANGPQAAPGPSGPSPGSGAGWSGSTGMRARTFRSRTTRPRPSSPSSAIDPPRGRPGPARGRQARGWNLS